MGIETINCKLITPMLMHGEDTRVAELRPPAIKGAMRFWWRAIHGNLTLKELKEQESKLFGGAGEDSTVRSSFRIKLITTSLQTAQIDPLPHKNSRFKISGYKENQNLKITLIISRELDRIKNIFKLSTILGGLGQRSRRGFGSIQIQESISEEYIKNLIKEINPSFNYTSNNAYPYIKNIKIGKEYSNMDELIRTISSATHSHNGDGMFGSVQGGRYASPVYISIIKENQKYKPIITTLNATKRVNTKRLKAFIGAIL